MRRCCNFSQQADRQSLGEETVTCAIVSRTNIIGLSKSDSFKSVGKETTWLSLSRLTSSHSANCSSLAFCIDRSIADFTMYWRPPPPPACASESNYGHFQLFPGWKLWKRRRVNTQLRGFRGKKNDVGSQQRLSNIPRKWQHKTMMNSVCSCGNLLFQHLNTKKKQWPFWSRRQKPHNQLKNCLCLGFSHFPTESCRTCLALVCFFIFIIIFYVATGVRTNRITRRAAQPCFRYSWYHIATACQLFDNEVEARFWWLMWQWGKVEREWLLLKEKERERRKALIPRRLWKWLRCDFRLIMRIMLLLDNKSSMIWFIFSKNLYQYLID